MTIGKKHHPQNQTVRKPMPSHKCIVMKFIDFCSNWINLPRLATILYPPKQLQPLGAEDKTSAAFLSPASCGVDSKPKKASSGRVITQIPTSQTQRVYPKISKMALINLINHWILGPIWETHSVFALCLTPWVSPCFNALVERNAGGYAGVVAETDHEKRAVLGDSSGIAVDAGSREIQIG
jgi:hypothetical protein